MSTDEVQLRARRTVISRLVIDGALVGGALIGVMDRAINRPGFDLAGTPASSIPIAVTGIATTALLSLVVLLTRDARNAKHDFARALAAAVVNAPACFGVHALATFAAGAGHHRFGSSDFFEVPLGILGLTLIAMVVTLPLGTAYGAMHALAMSTLRRELRVPSWRALTRARAIALGVGVVATGVMASLISVNRDVADLLAIPTSAIASLSLVDAVLLAFEHARMRRWKRALASDEALRIVPAVQARVDPSLAPLEPIEGEADAIVSARTEDPYRARPVAIALVRR